MLFTSHLVPLVLSEGCLLAQPGHAKGQLLGEYHQSSGRPVSGIVADGVLLAPALLDRYVSLAYVDDRGDVAGPDDSNELPFCLLVYRHGQADFYVPVMPCPTCRSDFVSHHRHGGSHHPRPLRGCV